MKENSDINWIAQTGFGIKAYSVEYQVPQIHENILEIIYCLQGSVKFFYSYEEFLLQKGEFISVDKDAFYLYAGKDNICVSFYFDLDQFSKKYPYIKDILFICEGTSDAESGYPSLRHEEMKGALLALLYYMVRTTETCMEAAVLSQIQRAADHIIQLMVDQFDILYYYKPKTAFTQIQIERHRELQGYMNRHKFEKLPLRILADRFHLTAKYISEFLSRNGLPYQDMLTYLRANASEAYLLGTELSIVEISEACGFSDVKYYYKAFRKWYRCTPREFRAKYRAAEQQEQMDYDIDLRSLREEIEHQILEHYMKAHLGQIGENLEQLL
ncbi:MAG: helix-turn-helix transcriptional regulator [Firmicutes bacterium]|jgi:AraC-like DNA-binding protein|nr:helix-turn-helix transcriptional regulator [Bacillota bacterium]